MFESLLMGPLASQRGKKLSGELWSRLVDKNLSPDGSGPGASHEDDFSSVPNCVATTAAGQIQPDKGGFAYIEADATPGAVRASSTEPSVMELLTSTDAADGDNHDTILITGGNVGVIGAAADSLLIFEARVSLPSVTDGNGSRFVGMVAPGRAQANGVILDSSGHALADTNLIGFFVSEDDNDKVKFVYRAAGQAAVEVLSVDGLAADTYYNLGFVFDPKAKASERLKIFVDNDEQSTYVTASDIASAAFPTSKLAACAAVKASANNDPQSMKLDLWAAYQGG